LHFDELSRNHKSERWSEIANLIDLFDDIVSIESVESSIALLDKDEYRMLNERLEFTYHKISNIRGILTSLLHKAKFFNEFLEIYNVGISKPQQYIFQIFKEIIEELEINKTVVADIEKEYDSFFGTGKYNSLKGLTNDPKKNFKLFIEPFWEREIEVNSNKLKLKMLDVKKQQEILSKILCDILKNNISKCPKLPKDDFANDIANLLISDLVYPCNINAEDINHYAKQQLDIIGKSKAKLFNKTKGERLCPICYKIMPEANLITAAFLSDEKGVAKVFNNHAIASVAFDI